MGIKKNHSSKVASSPIFAGKSPQGASLSLLPFFRFLWGGSSSGVFAFTLLVIIYFSTLFGALGVVHAETVDEQRARLKAELAQIEKDIALKVGVLKEKQKERTSLERDVAILDAQIEKAKLSIRRRDITLRELGADIGEKKRAIEKLDAKVARSTSGLAQLIRRTREADDTSLVELALGGTFSDLFEDIDNFETIQDSISISFREMKALRESLSERKIVLQTKHQEEEQMRRIQILEKRKIESRKRQKHKILSDTKGEEDVYKKLIAAREKSAAEIRAALFTLRDSAAIPFGDAFKFAKQASAKTGVRPAFILGILSEESNLGENVGTGNWKTDMHPTRDRPVFEEITRELGLNPDKMPVSKKPWYGWGGAMGPAQFIPSTWILYKNRIAKIVGENPPNPWDARTAIFASALLLMDNGADKGTRASERLAALRYFAGWKNAKKPAYSFYGDEVMELADKFQRQIDILER